MRRDKKNFEKTILIKQIFGSCEKDRSFVFTNSVLRSKAGDRGTKPGLMSIIHLRSHWLRLTIIRKKKL